MFYTQSQRINGGRKSGARKSNVADDRAATACRLLDDRYTRPQIAAALDCTLRTLRTYLNKRGRPLLQRRLDNIQQAAARARQRVSICAAETYCIGSSSSPLLSQVISMHDPDPWDTATRRPRQDRPLPEWVISWTKRNRTRRRWRGWFRKGWKSEATSLLRSSLPVDTSNVPCAHSVERCANTQLARGYTDEE